MVKIWILPYQEDTRFKTCVISRSDPFGSKHSPAPGIRRAWSSEGKLSEDGSECGPRSEPARVPNCPNYELLEIKIGGF